MKKIYRSLMLDTPESGESRTISGYAVVFDSLSREMYDKKGTPYYEKISRGAITEDVLANSDITMNLNHNDAYLLARYRGGEGTLHLELREDGLFFSFEAPTTSLGDEVLYNVRSGNLYECSFAFYINEKIDIIQYKRDGVYYQEITNIPILTDCSIVTRACYPETSVSAARSLEEVEDIAANVEEIERAAKEEEELQKREQEKSEELVRNAQILQQLDEKLQNFYKNISI